MTSSLADLCRAAAVEQTTLDVWIQQEWLRPERTPAGPSFSDRDVARARFIVDLRSSLGVNDEGVDVILHLVDQLHGMRRALAELRDGLGKP